MVDELDRSLEIAEEGVNIREQDSDLWELDMTVSE